MVPHSSNKDPPTKENYSKLPLMTSNIKKQRSEIEMTRGPIVDQVGRENFSDGRIFWKRPEG